MSSESWTVTMPHLLDGSVDYVAIKKSSRVNELVQGPRYDWLRQNGTLEDSLVWAVKLLGLCWDDELLTQMFVQLRIFWANNRGLGSRRVNNLGKKQKDVVNKILNHIKDAATASCEDLADVVDPKLLLNEVQMAGIVCDPKKHIRLGRRFATI